MTNQLKISNDDQSVTKVLTYSEKYINEGFTKAEVLFPPPSLWILYDKPDFDYGGKGTVIFGVCDYKQNITSAQGFSSTDTGIVLFQGSNYTGFGEEFHGDAYLSKITFPPGLSRGVSSFIVTGGIWQLRDANGDLLGTGGQTGQTGQNTFPMGEYNFPEASNNKATKVELVANLK